MVTGNDSSPAWQRKSLPGLGTWPARLGGWKAIAAGVGTLLLGSALTILPCLAVLKRDRLLMRRMTADVVAEFSDIRGSWHRWELSVGTVVTLAASFAAWRYFSQRDRSSVAQSKYLTGLELLHRTILRVGSQMGQGREVLMEMAEAARRLLGMDSSVVLLLDADQRVFLVHAESGSFPANAPSSFPVEQTPACFSAAQSGQVVFMDDADAEPPGINFALVRELGAKSAAVIPLRLGGKPAGVMVLADARPRRFTASDRELAEMLGAQTEVTLANSRLYEQTRATAGVYENLLLQQEALYEVAAAVYHAPSFDESARAVVDRAPAMLHVNGSSVLVCEDGGTTLRFVASFGEGAPAVVGQRFPVAGTHAEPLLRTGEMLVIQDARNTDTPPQDVFRLRKVGSIVFLPLKRADRTAFGLLVLVRHCTGPFADEQLRLFQVFADRAEAALENSMLQEQTRQDARTKTVLLRELHHRVNNNLAGIVALLTVNQPELSDAARRWIHRSIERIEAMARAHDLFTQGADRVRLSDVVTRVPESIAVLQPAQVRIVTDLDEEETTLATSRAVSLAMVLHELCSNALLHGVKDGGQVAIRSLRMDRRISIQVCDDGIGFEPDKNGEQPSAGRRGGFGLQLVRELVGRELQGNMHIDSAPGRGTTVSIAFPLDHDEENQP
jgi:two-component sensor histidine kinase